MAPLKPLRNATQDNDELSEEHEHPKDAPSSIAHIVERTQQEARTPRSAAQKWIRDPSYLDTYITLIHARDTAVDSIAEIDLNPYVLTEYEEGDYVLRRYPATKIGQASPSKYGSWWREPDDGGNNMPMAYDFEKLWYTIQTLVMTKEYFADITHLQSTTRRKTE